MSIAENNHETTRPGGITGNGFKPGQSGNPGGRPKGIAKTVRETCGGSPERLAQVLLEIAENPKGRDRDRIAACSELLDRGWGKAPAFAAMEADDPLELGEIAREVQGIADELARRRAGRETLPNGVRPSVKAPAIQTGATRRLQARIRWNEARQALPGSETMTLKVLRSTWSTT
jgi:hypothetical protein